MIYYPDVHFTTLQKTKFQKKLPKMNDIPNLDENNAFSFMIFCTVFWLSFLNFSNLKIHDIIDINFKPNFIVNSSKF